MHDHESARHWRHPGVPGVDLLRARFIDHTFARHTHDGYVVGVIEDGVEVFDYRRAVHVAAAGSVVLIDPDEVHTGRAGDPGGWIYRTSYPSVEVVTDIATELSALRGTPHFPDPIISDERLARQFVAAHEAAERGDALAASTLLRTAFGRALRDHAAPAPPRASHRPSLRAVAHARDILHARLTDPPTLDELAAAVGLPPFTLLRAFRAGFGLPPHAYLNQLRVQRASALLDRGVLPADAALRVGFADQAHLTRHFKRFHGVPPGAYRRERRNVQDSPAA